MEQIVNELSQMVNNLRPGGGDQPEENVGEVERFGNMLTDFHLNETCMVLIVIYILLFMYKKEVMAMVNKFLK